MKSVLSTLRDRGFIRQCTSEAELDRALGSSSLTFYAGFDPTAASLHIGSLMPIMAMAHLQRAGHVPIAILGGGTTMVGDPSGKTEMRQLLDLETITQNAVGIRSQLERYLTLDDVKGKILNNADWLLPLSYVTFLRDIGRHFRVNEMLRAEAYRQRLEREEGLSFIEFNYQLLQAYDFLLLFQQHHCTLQIGGDDQWGNILAGTELIRKVESKDSFGLTFPLLTTARGEKMGKTAKGAVWLDASLTSPYEFYQYWINTDDRDVERFLAFFTFLDMAEVRRLGGLTGADLREAKEVLAFEATRLCHGEAEAEKARTASRAAFGGGGDDVSAIPSSQMSRSRLEQGINIIELLVELGLQDSKSAARRLIQQGGLYINGQQVNDIAVNVTAANIEDAAVTLRLGKKRYHRIVVG